MAAETLAVNGVDISTVAYLDGPPRLMTTPARRGGTIAVAGRHGDIRVPRKKYGPAEMLLPLWLLGYHPDLPFPAADTARQSLYDAADRVLQLFGSEIVTVDHGRPDGSVRRAVAEVLDVVDFTRTGHRDAAAKVTIALTIFGSFWSDLTTVTAGPSALTSGGTATLTAFAGATAPMEDLIITFGPGANPSLSQPATGVFFAYDGVIAAGRKLVVNTETWALTGTLDAGGTWTPTVTAARFGPDAKFFYLTPPSNGTAPVVSLTHTGGGSMSVTIAGYRRFLTG